VTKKQLDESTIDIEQRFQEQAPTLKTELDICFDLIKQVIEKKGQPSFELQDLQKIFRLPKKLKTLLELFLDELVKEGKLEKKEDSYSIARTQTKPSSLVENFTGKIAIHHLGFGFVTLKNFDVFIPKHLVLDAMDQDVVEVEILSLEGRNKKGPEGRVIKVVQRNRCYVVATVVEIKPGSLKVRVSLQGESQLALLPSPPEKIEIGDRLLLEVHSLRNQLHLIFEKRLGSIFDPLKDLEVIKEEFNLPKSFPKEAVDEANSFDPDITFKKHSSRRDLTDLFTVTIDPKTAKDFDDALSIEKTTDGYRLFVHVADASYYVKKGGHLDLEAIKRKNSVYLLGTCIPMLPPILADNLCSLKEGVNRLAVTVEMDLNAKGELINSQIYRSIIKSNHRLSYEQAFEILHETAKSKLKDHLLLMKELALHFKAIKHQRGAVDLSLSELVWKLGDDGVPTGFEISHYDITHQLVEEFMLKANEIIATTLKNKEVSLIYRVHESPSAETMQEFKNFCIRLGLKIPEQIGGPILAKIFDEHRESAFIQELTTRYIRSMRLATYSTDTVGHHGLMLENYTHFTSPIRRYVDIIIHRLLFNETYTQEQLDEIAKSSSELERHSARAESSYLQLKKLRYLDRKHKNDPDRIYRGAITKIKPFGIVFDVKDFGVEGFIHISDLGEDYYEFNPKKEKITGKRTAKTFNIGDHFDIKIDGVNLLFQEIHWKLT
jgi:ribonuclease R